MPKKDFFIKESELDDYQRVIMNKRTENSLIVKGCAGSGKSIIALWKAIEIQKSNKTFLLIVYTKTLKKYMLDGIKAIQDTETIELNNKNVTTYGKCFSWYRDENNKLIRGNWRLGKFDYIIVDEAQDFSIEALEIINSHANRVLFYGDSAQNLCQTFSFDNNPTVSMESIKIKFDYPLEQLVFNHRLPRTIARVAKFLNKEGDDLEGRCTKEGVEIPSILKYDSFEEQLKAIQRIIKIKKYEDVGVLFSRIEDVRKADEYFKKNDFSVETKIGDDITLDFKTTNPKLMPYKSSKGLQFEVVFLPNCSLGNEIDKNSLYVALTRSYYALYILFSEQLSEHFDEIPEDLYKTTEIIEEIKDI
jgi:DNA helicase IV